MASDSHNPYYAYIKLDIGNYSVDSRDDGGPISLQAVYGTEAFCTYTIEAYDDTAEQLSHAILAYGRNMYVEYGYTNGKGAKSQDVSITNIHTELIGRGEIITIETVPTPLSKVMNSANDASSCDKKYTGSASEILDQVLAETGWTKGYVVATAPLRGENNGNDDIYGNPDNYTYWSAEAPATEFMSKLKEFAQSTDGRKNYVLAVHYNKDEPPVVDFFPSEDTSQRQTHYLTYGDPDSEIISINIDWGDALLLNAGFAGVISNNQDTITNDEWGEEHSMEYYRGSTSGAKKKVEDLPGKNTGQKLNKSIGTVWGPMGKETWYGTLKPGSPVFSWTVNAGGGNASWPVYYRDDGVLMWGDYVCVAADISGNYGAEPGYPALPDHAGKYERGDIVDTSLGPGIVVDACRASCDVDYPWFDVAVNWKR